ncbi:P-loop containing nucleoside triphosphate hydrolase protein [Cutaneotrichosporon oleaginosum]|uniref:RNA helicase n=1 Tax=Cutaneotrichosporon oleaginosum TaxID=879819 RepID=A0A0J0XWH5_9TREE|nr:P-loop containing nucleoside triphosphate hydrolase protein [Cutaneotrichosporon oleaginosum]KLT45410.1 P-loop containing nucleoside triphosphate hydrolase protein [Cutaneotrichosporon oleaginosum]TXT14626.1 hypothetical protein COLE_00819 [Cutaneotrichosporon oleaginosum]
MGKKKLSLKPLNRGFATTSVQSKKAKGQKITTDVDQQPAEVNEASQPSEHESSKSGGNDGSQQLAAATTSTETGDDWESEQAIEDGIYQALVDRLQEKADKEVSRIVKSLEQEKRWAASFPPLRINDHVRDQALQYAREDLGGEDAGSKSLSPSANTSDGDKILLRTYVASEVLSWMGFSERRIEECILRGLGDGQGWAEAEEWMWLHLSDDECHGVGEFTKAEACISIGDDPLIDVTQDKLSLSSNTTSSNDPPVPTVRVEPTSLPAEPGSLFQSLEDSGLESSSESEDELNMNKTNETWAQLMLELEAHKAAAGPGKARGKKSKNLVVMETPETVKIKNKINRLEKEYMFSKKDADVLLKTMRTKRDMERLAVRLQNAGKLGDAASPAETPPIASVPDSLVSDDEESGGLFGNMLDEPEDPAGIKEDVNSLIKVRSMPVPKQFTFAGNTAKGLLRSALSKTARQAVVSYVRLSPNPRVARSGLEIRWSAEQRRAWRMDDIACESVEEADNYISTVALHDLVAVGSLPPVNWRSMPPAYRDLWDELERTLAEKRMATKRQTWKNIKLLVDQKIELKTATSSATNAKRTPLSTSAVGSPPRPSTPVFVDRLQNMYEKRTASPEYRKMRQARDLLPIAPFREQILETLDSTQVLVFSGETGCGKSTQLPAFILEDQLSKGKPCKIFVTEPRRISAISLAQRVSTELGEPHGAMGNASSLVGYSIRLEAKMSLNTRLAFVTNGIALRMLEGGGSSFDEVTHIVVDEVHERSIESDFLLIVLKQLLEVRKDLKVILMSATVDAEKISGFFGGCPAMQVPGRTFPVQVQFLEDAVELTGWQIDETSPYAVWDRNRKAGAKKLEWSEEVAETAEDAEEDNDDEKPADPMKLSASKYSSRTVSTVNLLDSRKIPYDLIIRLLERVCFEETHLQMFSAATLVFMPGLAEIRKLHEELQNHPHFGTKDFVIHPLHSSISSEGQSSVFDIPPTGVRKIVISTNIAETGVTIPDITCVIDSGKQREMRYDEKRQLSRLVETHIARSNAKQRRGRAGRVQEGLAFHLFTKARHDNQLAEHPIPEMLRLSLQDLALRIKILKVKMGNTVEEVLLKALDPPSTANIQRAVSALVEVKALTVDEAITPMGRLLSKLPMDVHLGKFLLLAALFKCLDPALTIAATLNSKSPFITPFGFESQATAAKRSFSEGNSDFLTIVKVFDTWRRAHDNPSFVRTFCKRNYVSHQTLQQIEELRQQLLAYLIDSGFVEATLEQKREIARARYSRGFKTRFVDVPPHLNKNSADERILGAALTSGLYPKILTIEASGSLRTISNQQPVSIHPSSINFGLPKSEFGTNNLVYYTLMQSKKLYAWETGPVDDRALALLCGDNVETKLSAASMQIDRKLRFQVDPKSALALKYLRDQLASAMAARLRGRSLTQRQSQWFELALECLATGVYEEQQTVIVS